MANETMTIETVEENSECKVGESKPDSFNITYPSEQKEEVRE